MGPPGAGKGTQSSLLAKKLGYHQFSTGNAFREIARQNSDLGRRVKATIDNGYLAPPAMAAEVVINAIKESVKLNRGLIFDATPRTVKEAAIVDDFFAKNNYGRPLAIYLEVTEKEMKERNTHRRYCLDTLHGFSVMNEADVKRCEEIGGRVGFRADDEPEKFAIRWSQFQENTYPVVLQYKKDGILFTVNGRLSIAKVHQEILSRLEKISNDSN